ncbi:MAG: PP2C family protein-serine/threonine phosphatase [Acidobacteriia bacterium]|nr:PP2C family protein-serine/threonine phosphatase [Terriglobia bacterium]
MTAASWKKIATLRFNRFLQVQQLLVFVAVVVYAMLAAMKLHASLWRMVAITLSVGNIMLPVMRASVPIYTRRAFPWNWVLFFPIMGAASLTSALAAIVIVHWLEPSRPPLRFLFQETAPLIMVICMVVGTVTYLSSEIQRRLREKNLALEQAVEKGSVALQKQEQELDRAREIQENLLPKSLPQLPGVQIAGAWQPARTVGGDYFDVIHLDDKRLGICIGDVAGKGITAALLMANLQAAFRAFATPEATPAEVCSKLNAFLCGNVAPGKFITFFYAVLNVDQHTVTYENAGHSPALLLKKAGHTESLCGNGAVLGVLPNWSYKDSVVRLEAGDRLLLFTDGVTEAANQQAEEFGEERLIQAARLQNESALHIQRKIMEEVSAFCRTNFHDDATLLVVAIE